MTNLRISYACQPPKITVLLNRHIRSLKYPDNILATLQANVFGADDVLMLDLSGFDVEVTDSEIVAVGETVGRIKADGKTGLITDTLQNNFVELLQTSGCLLLMHSKR